MTLYNLIDAIILMPNESEHIVVLYFNGQYPKQDVHYRDFLVHSYLILSDPALSIICGDLRRNVAQVRLYHFHTVMNTANYPQS